MQVKLTFLKWRPQEVILVNGTPIKNPSKHKVNMLVPEDAEIVRQVRGRPGVRVEIQVPEDT